MYRAYPPPPSSALFASQYASNEDKKNVMEGNQGGPPAPLGLKPPTRVAPTQLHSSSSSAPSNVPPPPLKREHIEPITSPDVSYNSSLNQEDFRIRTDNSIVQRRNELHKLQERANGSNADNLLARARAATQKRSYTAVPPPSLSSASSGLKHAPPTFSSSSNSTSVDVKSPPSPPRRSSIPPPKVYSASNADKVDTLYEPHMESNESDGVVIHQEENPIVPTHKYSERDAQSITATTVHVRPPPPPHPNATKIPSPEQSQVMDKAPPIPPPFTDTTTAPIPTAPSSVLTPSPPPPQGNTIPVPPTTTNSSSKREALTSLWNVAPTPNSSVAEIDTSHPLPPPSFDTIKNEAVPVPDKIETTQNAPKESGTLRLVKELRKTKESLEEALKREYKLESQIMELKLNNLGSSASRGRAPRSVVDERSNNESRKKRMKSPEPSGRKKNVDPLSDINIASRAVETVDHVFESTLATYVVRKPYGGNEQMECIFKDENMLNDVGATANWTSSVLTYLQVASVKDERTLEVAAKLKADGSVLIVCGSSCRHGTLSVSSDGNEEFEFRIFNDAEYMDGSLGKILYIDTEGNDGEYWLDPVYEEALSIRESYCSNVYSAALALEVASPKTGSSPLQANQNSFHTFQTVSQQPHVVKPPTTDACVGTEDLKVPTATSIPIQTETKKAPVKAGLEEKKLLDMESFEKQGSGSTGFLSSFIIFFFSSIFSLVWFLLMIPVRISKLSITLMIGIAIYQIVWTLLADYEVVALIDTNYNTY